MSMTWRAGTLAALLASVASGCSGSDDDVTGTGPAPNPPSATPSAGKATYARELRGGRVHQVDVASFTGAAMAPADVIGSFETALRPALGRLQAQDLALVATRREVTPGRQNLTHVSYRQEVGGVPIVGTYINLTLKQNASGGARLLASSHRLYDKPAVDVKPVMTTERAAIMGKSALRARDTAKVIKNDLEIRNIGGRLELVYAVKVEGDYHRALVIASGPARRSHRGDRRAHPRRRLRQRSARARRRPRRPRRRRRHRGPRRAAGHERLGRRRHRAG
jgi:hypothetical protein